MSAVVRTSPTVVTRWVAGSATVASVLLTGCAGGAPSDRNAIRAAAERFCPLLWDYVTDVGSTFNVAAADVAGLPTATQRRDRWERALDDVERRLQDLETEMSGHLDDGVVGPLAAEVVRDVPAASAELADIRALFVDAPLIDEQRHQARTQQVIVRLEKVIDLPKPDLAPNDPEGTLRVEFRAVPACQHAIRDADDGTPRANG